MKTKLLLISSLAALALIFAACGQETKKSTSRRTPDPQDQTSRQRVPAFQPANAKLGPTISPERFTGLTREAYRIVAEIPDTIAQLPCYCHCDQSIGHKSLHSCFEDMHASQCAVCVNEVLMAKDLSKRGMSPSQIREQIIAQFSIQ